jgi:hypothetical protein
MSSQRLRALLASILVAASTSAPAQYVSGVIGWGWPGYGPYWPGYVGPLAPCGFSGCADNPYLRRAIQREIARMEFLNELEERAQRGAALGRLPYVHTADWPPPTPEAHIQPAYRRSGEIRPEFTSSGTPR